MMTRDRHCAVGSVRGGVARRLFWPVAVLLMLWALHALTSPLGGSEPDDTAVVGEGEEVERLDTFLNHLNAERRPTPERLSVHELRERIVAVHLRGACRGVAEPTPPFLYAVGRRVAQAMSGNAR